MEPTILVHQYRTSKNLPQLKAGEIHIWNVHMEDFAEDCEKADCLSSSEKEQLLDFKSPKRQHEFLVGHTILRLLLSHYGNCLPEEIILDTAQHGKPIWQAPQNSRNLEFNLSHSGEWIAIAISIAIPLGIDVEQIRQRKRITEGCDLQTYFQDWTAKEAILKATGTGFTAKLPEDSNWATHHFPVDEHYLGCVAYKR